MRNIEVIDGEVFIDGELWEEDDLLAISEVCERKSVKAEITNYLSRAKEIYPDDEQVAEIMEYYFENKDYTVGYYQQVREAINACLFLDEENSENEDY